MSSSLYSALNGEEIRTIIKNRIIKEVDNLPYLKKGNSFHKANVQFAFVMQAYPADVPVPDDKEIDFSILAKSFQEQEDAINRVEKADLLVNNLNELNFLKEKIEALIVQAQEKIPSMIREHEIRAEIDGTRPDLARVANELPVTVEKMESGKRIEKQVSSVEFKKMVK